MLLSVMVEFNVNKHVLNEVFNYIIPHCFSVKAIYFDGDKITENGGRGGHSR